MSQKNLRKTVLIDRSFQVGFVLRFMVLNAMIMVGFGFLIYMFLDSEVQSTLSSAHASYSTLRDMLLPIVLTLSLINVLVSSLIVAVFVLYLSHRIAGPVFRFRSCLLELSQRNLSPLTKIRDKDQLQDVSDVLERLTGTLKEDITAIKSGLEQVEEGIKGEVSDEVDVLIKALRERLDRYHL